MSDKYNMRVVSYAGSLSEQDLILLVGSDLVEQMMRNRILVAVDSTTSPDWEVLLNGIRGLYHIRKIGQEFIQLWFESDIDLNRFQQNLTVSKVANS